MIAALRILDAGDLLPDAVVVALHDSADREALAALESTHLLVRALPRWRVGEEVSWLTYTGLVQWRSHDRP